MPSGLFNRANAAYLRVFPKRELYVRSNGAVRYLTLSPAIQGVLALSAVGLIGWAATLTVQNMVSDTEIAFRDQAMIEVKEAYEARIRKLQDRYVRLEAELTDSERRFDDVMRQLSGKHGQLESAAGVEVALQGRLDASRRRLTEVTEQRDDALTKLEDLRLRSLELERRFARAQRMAEQRRADLEDFIGTLESTTDERDTARRQIRELTTEVGKLTTDIEAIRAHQSRVMAQLDEATTVSLGKLESIIGSTGANIDTLLREIENTYGGEGGPFIPIAHVAPAAAAGFPINEETVQSALERLRRVNSLNFALQKSPMAQPIKATHRFTSGFGRRRHPITGRYQQHQGIDLAAPRGTKVHATADGVVKFAGRNGGFGKMVRINHALGFETRYAHLSKIHVKVGERITAGDVIGDVGSTGRSTGPHLHYEIVRNGDHLNPRKFIEAGRDVF